MQENDFEKKMQAQLDQFRLDPDDALWPKIAARLPGKKKRRVLWWWLSAAAVLLLVGGLGYKLVHAPANDAVLVKPPTPNVEHAATTNAGTIPSTAASTEAVTSASTAAPTADEIASRERNDTHAATATEPATQAGGTNTKAAASQTSPSPKPAQRKKAHLPSTTQTTTATGNVSNRDRTAAGRKRITVQAPAPTEASAGETEKLPNDLSATIAGKQDQQKPSTSAPLPAVDTPAGDKQSAAASLQADGRIAGAKAPQLIDSTLNEGKGQVAIPGKKSVKKRKAWITNISLEGGRSFVFGKANGGQPLYAAQDGFSNSIPSAIDSLASLRSIATESAGWAGAGGVSFSRPIHRKWMMEIGGSYRLLTTRMNVAPLVYSPTATVRNFADSFVVNRDAQYTSYYHQLSIPLNLAVNLAGEQHKEIWLRTGIDIAWLFSSNSLQLNGATGRYYKSNDPLNRFSVGLQAGLAFNLAGRDKAPLYIGPEYYYSLSPLAGSGIHRGTRMNFAGIRVTRQLGHH